MKKLIICFVLCSVAYSQPIPLMRDPLAVHKDDLVFNVKDPHGGLRAVGDGVTDDTAAIQAANNAAEAANGATVYFPPGTYLVTIAANNGITIDDSVVWMGATYRRNDIGTDTPASKITVTGDSATSRAIYCTASGVQIRNLAIDGGDGWAIRNTLGYMVVDNCYLSGTAGGIWNDYCIATEISNNRILTDGKGIRIDRGTTFTIRKNYIGVLATDAANSACIYLGDPTTSTPAGDHTSLTGVCQENILESLDYGIYLDCAHGILKGIFSAGTWYAQRIVLIGNYFEQLDTNGVWSLDTNLQIVYHQYVGSNVTDNFTWSQVSDVYYQHTNWLVPQGATFRGLQIGPEPQMDTTPAAHAIVVEGDTVEHPPSITIQGHAPGSYDRTDFYMVDTANTGWHLKHYGNATNDPLYFYPYTTGSDGVATMTLTTDGNVQLGANGLDGKLTLYSEQGATDYSATINPNTAMTSNANFYWPADEPAATSLMTMTTGGVMVTQSASAGLAGALSDETGTGVAVFGTNPTFTTNVNTPQVTLTDADASPDAVGEVLYDNTITGLDDGGLVWYDDDEIRTIVDLDSSETLAAGDDGKIVRYNWSAGAGYFDLVAAGAGIVTSVGDGASAAALDGSIDGGTWIKFYDADGIGQLITGNLTAARVWTLPDATGTLALAGGAGANQALDNLAGVAINTSLISDLAATDDLGTEALYWKKLYLGSDISFEGTTDDAYQTTLTAVDPTVSDKSINIPNASGTMAVSATTPISLSATGGISIADAVSDGATKGAATFAAVDFDDAAGVITLAAAICRDAEVPGLETNAAVDTEAELEAITGAYFGASKVVTAGYIWVADGTDFESVPMSGDVSIATGGATTVANDSHTHVSANISDKNAGTDLTADLEEEVTEGSLANSTIVSDDIKDGTVAIVDMAAAAKTAAVNFIIDGRGSAITTGIKADICIPYACTITGVAILGDQSGSIVIDLWQGTIAEQIAGTIVDADSITAADLPTVTTAIGSDDDTLTGWDASVNALQVIRVNVDSITTLTRVTLVLKLSKT